MTRRKNWTPSVTRKQTLSSLRLPVYVLNNTEVQKWIHYFDDEGLQRLFGAPAPEFLATGLNITPVSTSIDRCRRITAPCRPLYRERRAANL